jgi:hypothetical protein
MTMDRDTYLARFKEGDSPGWEAIDAACDRLHGSQKPRHYAPAVPAIIGGPDPIDGVSMYDSTAGGRAHVHMVTYGMSVLHFDPEAAGAEFSGHGFEFTARIAPFAGDPDGPHWMTAMMNNLARYLNQSGRWFEPGHFLNAKGPIRLNTQTSLVAIAFTEDPELGTIETPHGAVQFLQIVGLTATQYAELELNPDPERTLAMLEAMKADNPFLVIDLAANP